MGSHLSTTWFIYSREENDDWSENPLASTLTHEKDVNYHIGRFKHLVYKMCVGKLQNIRKVYLYHGWRMIKAVMDKNELCLEFTDKATAEKWWESDEECIETGVYSKEFDKKWKVRDAPSSSKITYDLLKD